MHNRAVSRLEELVLLGFAKAGVAVAITDSSGQLLHLNEAFADLFGWSADDEIHLRAVVQEEDQAWLVSFTSRLVSGDEDEFQSQQRFVRRDGSCFDGSLVVRAIREHGQCVGAVCHVMPRGRRKLLADHQATTLLEHSASAVTLLGATGDVIETSARYRQSSGQYRSTLGYPPEFWDTRSIFDVLVPEQTSQIAEMGKRLLEQPGGLVTTDIRVLDAAGEEQILEATAVNLLDDPDVGGIVITTHNVTEERAARAQIAFLRDQAVAEADRRSRLIATVSHELRNPLHALAGLSELLASAVGMDESQQSIASTLHRQVTQMSRVTDDLLDHTLLELGQTGPQIGPTSVRAVVDDMIVLAQAAVGSRLVDVAADVEAEVPAIVATDGSRLHQLVWNLVENAIKFTDRGRVDVSVSCVERTAEACRLRIAVADTGLGLAADDLDRIFEPFCSTAPASGRSGAGLGLSIARHILEILAGTIDVTSELGRGSTFAIEIPMTILEAEPVAVGQGPAEAGSGERPVVMVVEDNEVNQELARHQLNRLGMLPMIVGSAEQALEILRDRSVQAILMDHQLPGMNGREATQEMRRLGVVTPVVGVTASATAADERACIEAGMDAFLAKPVGLEQLRKMLDGLLGKERSARRRALVPALARSCEADAAAVDPDTLAQLASELGDPSIVGSLVTTFLDELDQRCRDITTSDPDAAARQAHSLKSGARMLGAFPLADACAGLEDGRVDARTVVERAGAAETAFRGWLVDHRVERARA